MAIVKDNEIDIPVSRIDDSHEVIDTLLSQHRDKITMFCKLERLVDLKYHFFIEECITFRFEKKYYIRIRMSGLRLTKARKYLFNFFVKSGWRVEPPESPKMLLEELSYNRQIFFQRYCKGTFFAAQYIVQETTENLTIDYIDVELPTDKKLQFSAVLLNEKGLADDFYYFSMNYPSLSKHDWNSKIDYYSRKHYISAHLNGTSKKELYHLYYIKSFYPDAKSGYQFENATGRKIEADIYVPSLNTVIEYDGGYWHKKKLEIDVAKNEWFQQQGFHIVRIRDADLPELPPFNGVVILHGVDLGGKHSDECVVEMIHYLASLENSPLKKQELLHFSLSYQEYCDDEIKLYDLIKEREMS